MAEEFILTSYGDLPQELRDDVSDGVSLHSVVILSKHAGDDWRQVGSGTLVRFKRLTGILTAGHVVDALEMTTWLGFNVSDRAHLTKIRTELTTLDKLYEASNEGSLPDLGFIVLPESMVREIEARQKAMYNLARREDKPISAVKRLEYAAWVIWGSPGELTSREISESPPGDIQLHQCQSSFCGLVPSDEFDGIDALVADVDYGNCVGNLPKTTFGGYSGGGLWYVPLVRGKSGEIRPREYILVGVVCLESGDIGSECQLICHGPESVLGYLEDLDRRIGT